MARRAERRSFANAEIASVYAGRSASAILPREILGCSFLQLERVRCIAAALIRADQGAYSERAFFA